MPCSGNVLGTKGYTPRLSNHSPRVQYYFNREALRLPPTYSTHDTIACHVYVRHNTHHRRFPAPLHIGVETVLELSLVPSVALLQPAASLFGALESRLEGPILFLSASTRYTKHSSEVALVARAPFSYKGTRNTMLSNLSTVRLVTWFCNDKLPFALEWQDVNKSSY